MQEIFLKIVENPFSQISMGEFTDVSIAIWHRGFVPNVSGLDGLSALKAMYVLDSLRRFNCMSDDSKIELKTCISTLSRKVIYQKSYSNEVKVSKLAMHYGLNEDLKKQLRECLDFQTRHYSRIEKMRSLRM